MSSLEQDLNKLLDDPSYSRAAGRREEFRKQNLERIKELIVPETFERLLQALDRDPRGQWSMTCPATASFQRSQGVPCCVVIDNVQGFLKVVVRSI